MLQGSRVLLLEDDSAVIELLELTLQARGAQVSAVQTAQAFEEKLHNGNFEILLIDLSPVGDGLDRMLSKAHAGNPNVITVVISGSVSIPPRTDVIWVRKPFEPGELVSAIVDAQRDAQA